MIEGKIKNSYKCFITIKAQGRQTDRQTDRQTKRAEREVERERQRQRQSEKKDRGDGEGERQINRQTDREREQRTLSHMNYDFTSCLFLQSVIAHIYANRLRI